MVQFSILNKLIHWGICYVFWARFSSLRPKYSKVVVVKKLSHHLSRHVFVIVTSPMSPNSFPRLLCNYIISPSILAHWGLYTAVLPGFGYMPRNTPQQWKLGLESLPHAWLPSPYIGSSSIPIVRPPNSSPGISNIVDFFIWNLLLSIRFKFYFIDEPLIVTIGGSTQRILVDLYIFIP